MSGAVLNTHIHPAYSSRLLRNRPHFPEEESEAQDFK